jgi:hypothetical protein
MERIAGWPITPKPLDSLANPLSLSIHRPHAEGSNVAGDGAGRPQMCKFDSVSRAQSFKGALERLPRSKTINSN